MDHHVGPMVNPMVMAQVRTVLQEEDPHAAVVEEAKSADAAGRKGLLESPSWSETYLPMPPLLICKEPLERLEKFEMSIFQETTTHSSPRDLPLLNMLILKRQGKHAMRWIDFESRGGNSKLSLLKSDARLLRR